MRVSKGNICSLKDTASARVKHSGGWRRLNAEECFGWPMLSLFESVGLLTLFFSRLSRIHRIHSAPLIAVQPSFSTFRCKTLNIFIKVCYSLPCTPNPIPAGSFPGPRVTSVNSASLRWAAPSLIRSQTFNFQPSAFDLSPPPNPFPSCRLPTPTP